MGIWKALALSGVMGATVGCGDELADSSYQGEPRIELKGTVDSLAPGNGAGSSYVGILWSNWAKNGDTQMYQTAELRSDALPFEYTLQVLDTPDPKALNNYDGELFGTGYIVAFEDGNGDGLGNDPSDTLRGLAPQHIVFYADKITPELKAKLVQWGRIRNVDALKDGFNLLRGICSPDTGRYEDLYDDLEVVANQPVPIVSLDAEVESCLNFN